MTHLCNLTTPQHEYQAAQRVIQRFIQTFGLVALEAQGPKRCCVGWFTPLFTTLFLYSPKAQR